MKLLARQRIALISTFIYWSAIVAGFADPASSSRSQERAVVLVFISSCSSYAKFVAPLLKKHKFQATFYVEPPPPPRPNPLMITPLAEPDYLTWMQIRDLLNEGFEIGNVTLRSGQSIRNMTARGLAQELGAVEQLFQENGIPKPTTFCYPGRVSSASALQVLADKGYVLAVDSNTVLAFDPTQDHPLLIPGVLFLGSGHDPERFKQTMESLRPGQIPVLCFDRIASRYGGTSTHQFSEYVHYLVEQKYKVISVRDLATYAQPGIDMRAVRVWRRTGSEYQASLPARGSPQKAQRLPAKLQQQLEQLVLPKIDFEKATLESALHALTKLAETISNGQIRPGLIPKAGSDITVPVTLHLTNVPFMEALNYLGDLALVEFTVDDYAISISPKTGDPAESPPKTPATRDQMKAFGALILPKVKFSNTTLNVALDQVSQEAERATLGKWKPTFIIPPELDTTKPVTLHLSEIPFTEALRYLGDLAGIDFTINRYAIVATRKRGSGKPESAPTPFALVH